MKKLTLATTLAALLSSSFATADGRKPGSLLLYPLQRADIGFTILALTNTAVQPAGPTTFGDSTNVHFHYVNVQPHEWLPTRTRGCSVFDRVEFLTPADTLSVLVNCHNPSGAFGSRGYVVAIAENPSAVNTPWSHNHLVGSATVALATGVIFQYNALAQESLAADGDPADVSPANFAADFNGVEYETLPERLYVDSFSTLATQSLALANLTGRTSDINRIHLTVWNDNEFPMSLTFEMDCWFHAALSDLSPLFTQEFMASVPNDPEEFDCTCDGVGDVESGWLEIQSVGTRTPGGHIVADDGAIVGVLSGIGATGIGGRLLWEDGVQTNGSFGLMGPN